MPDHDAMPAGPMVLAGRYRLEMPLRARGNAEVFRATQLSIGRAVVLRRLRPELVQSLEERQRFIQGAQVAQRLVHPNTPRVIDLGQADDGTPFLVEELVTGHPLDELLRQEGAWPPARIVHVAKQALRALGEAHRQGLVHGGVQASALVLSNVEGEPDFLRLIDFGVLPGVDPRQDLRDLGQVLAEMLTGQPMAGRRKLPRAVRRSPLAPVLQRALSTSPGGGFRSAPEMSQALEALPTDPRPRAPRSRRPVLLVVMILVALAALAVVSVSGGLLLGRIGGRSAPVATAPRTAPGEPATAAAPSESRLATLTEVELLGGARAAGLLADACQTYQRPRMEIILCPLHGTSNGSMLLIRYHEEADARAAVETELARGAVVVRWEATILSVWLQPLDPATQERVLRSIMAETEGASPPQRIL